MVAIRSGTLCAPFLALALLGACSAPAAQDPAEAAAAPSVPAHCVTLAEGLYEYDDGQFLAVSAATLALSGASGWEGEMQAAFTGAGFPWMGLKVRGRVATLTGTAPSAAAKAAAVSAGEATIAAHPEAGRAGLIVVDAVSVQGGERGVGESLAVLADSGANLETCQRAFKDTMAGRTILFEAGNARISPVSARLLDAVTGIAALCSQFVIEISGHTDSRGGEDYNLNLSQGRADAVRAYLVSKGVSQEGLVSVGYGETRPLDPAPTPEAYNKNRRTEFNVIAR